MKKKEKKRRRKRRKVNHNDSGFQGRCQKYPNNLKKKNHDAISILSQQLIPSALTQTDGGDTKRLGKEITLTTKIGSTKLIQMSIFISEE